MGNSSEMIFPAARNREKITPETEMCSLSRFNTEGGSCQPQTKGGGWSTRIGPFPRRFKSKIISIGQGEICNFPVMISCHFQASAKYWIFFFFPLPPNPRQIFETSFSAGSRYSGRTVRFGPGTFPKLPPIECLLGDFPAELAPQLSEACPKQSSVRNVWWIFPSNRMRFSVLTIG